MSHVTNGSFLWYRLFCTMWQFVTRSRYKNKVHVWVFLKNKSGYVSHYSLDLSQDSSHMFNVVSHTMRATVNTVNNTVDLRRRTRKSSRESVALTCLSSPDPPSYINEKSKKPDVTLRIMKHRFSNTNTNTCVFVFMLENMSFRFRSVLSQSISFKLWNFFLGHMDHWFFSQLDQPNHRSDSFCDTYKL